MGIIVPAALIDGRFFLIIRVRGAEGRPLVFRGFQTALHRKERVSYISLGVNIIIAQNRAVWFCRRHKHAERDQKQSISLQLHTQWMGEQTFLSVH